MGSTLTTGGKAGKSVWKIGENHQALRFGGFLLLLKRVFSLIVARLFLLASVHADWGATHACPRR